MWIVPDGLLFLLGRLFLPFKHLISVSANEISVIDLQSPFERAHSHVLEAEIPSIIQCHPDDHTRFALVVGLHLPFFCLYRFFCPEIKETKSL